MKFARVARAAAARAEGDDHAGHFDARERGGDIALHAGDRRKFAFVDDQHIECIE